MNEEEAIEILRNECINTYAERKALAIHTVLNLIEKQKAEIETLKRDFEIVDHECSRLEQEDIRKDMIINEMEKYIDEITEKIAREKGVEDFEFCDNKCADIDEYIECKQCIKEYFENKVKESK